MPADRDPNTCPSDAEIRASAGRIVDILQQLVLLRPDLVIPVEELLMSSLPGLRIHVVTQLVTAMWAQQDSLASAGR